MRAPGETCRRDQAREATERMEVACGCRSNTTQELLIRERERGKYKNVGMAGKGNRAADKLFGFVRGKTSEI